MLIGYPGRPEIGSARTWVPRRRCLAVWLAAGAALQVAAISLFNPGGNSTVDRRLVERFLAEKRLSYRSPWSPVKTLDDLAQDFILRYKLTCEDKRGNETNSTCPCVSPELVGRLRIQLLAPPWDEVARQNDVLKVGGEWSPADCRNTEKLAIVIPYRDREEHLRIFLNHMHPILRRQRITYRVFVVEQAFPEVFNKASMMNIGFVEAMKSASYDCVIFHDVDMLLEDDRHIYRCSDNIRHMGANVNKFGYKLVYDGLIGGALAFRTTHFVQVNGFGNKFFGWGGEDDDMWQRIKAVRLPIIRFPAAVSRYTMIKHGRDKPNPSNPYSSKAWTFNPKEYKRDGLCNLKYRIHDKKLKPLYTWIYAEPAVFGVRVAYSELSVSYIPVNVKYARWALADLLAVTSLSRFRSYWGNCVEHTSRLWKASLIDCAATCLTMRECHAFAVMYNLCAFKTRACTLRVTDTCQYSRCNRIYVKNESIELQQFLEVDGDCRSVEPTTISWKLDLVNCARMCANDSACASFVYSFTGENCAIMPRFCNDNETQISTTSTIFYKIPDDVMLYYVRRGGDCTGDDLGGHDLSREACALKCRLLQTCVGFVFVSTHSRSCWPKHQACARTTPKDGADMYDRKQ
ncbi:Beta-1,4-galactosyltransferase 2 [Lamellibrachia satsuma]|nr:Beta-1,4-galactosyltransferase 2 [Lamellibrachia satsuma]